jgi:transposase-like protein
MEINPSQRKNWSAEEKLFFVMLLTIPQKNGKPKRAGDVADDYSVTAKTLYEWLKLYQSNGREAFSNTSRKSNTSKSHNPELQEEIFRIALLNPMFTGKEIIQNLSPAWRRITLPTVQKILKLKELNTLKKRLIATEYEHVKRNLIISKSTLDYLIQKNPYFDLYQLNKNIEGSLFYLKCLDLSKLYGASAGYLLLAVDTKSLTTFSQIWDGNYLDVPKTFIKDLSKIFSKNGAKTYFESEDNQIFRKLKKTKPLNQINWFDSAQHSFSPDRFDIALNELLKLIQAKFLKNYTFTSVENLHVDLEGFLLIHRTTDGPTGYPTFGQPPYHLNKHNF